MGLSQLATERGDTAVGVRYLERAWEASPGKPRVGLELIKSYLLLNKNLSALNVARELVATRSDNADVLRRVGLLLMQGGEFGEAISTFRKIVQLKPDSVEARYMLAMSQVRGDRPRDALESLDSLLVLDPKFVPALAAKARVLLKTEQFERALGAARKVQQLDSVPT